MLVVDDEVLILNLLREVFHAVGYKVFTAESGEEALKILQHESIMVMFLDIKLPGISGIELCKKIRTENQICIIHVITGYNNIYGLLECRAAGFDDFFVKPVGIKLFKKAAQEAFEKLERWDVHGHQLI
ncbi:MAG: response regulator [Smithella sp.]